MRHGRLLLLVCLIVGAAAAPTEGQPVIPPTVIPAPFGGGTMSVAATAMLDADSVFVAMLGIEPLSSSTLSFVTGFLVVNIDTGRFELPFTPLPGRLTQAPTVAVLSPDEVMITVCEGEHEQPRVGRYFVVNPRTGAIVRGPITFSTTGTGIDYRMAVLDASAVLLAYRSGDLVKGKFTVVNPQTGSVRVPETTFAPSIGSIDVVTLDSRRVLGVYERTDDAALMYFVVDPETGTMATGPTELPGVTGNMARLVKLDANLVQVHYGTVTDTSSFFTLNASTGERTDPVAYATPAGSQFSLSPSLLGTNAVFMPFGRNTPSGQGQFVVRHRLGDPLVNETSFDPDHRAFFISSSATSCRALIAYDDGAGNGPATYQVRDFWDVCTPPPGCPDDVTAQVDIIQFPIATFLFAPLKIQLVLVHNRGSEPILGPQSLLLEHLTNARALTYTTARCASVAAIPFATIQSGSDDVLSPGEIGGTFVFFVQQGSGAITYTPRVLRASR